jgi:hypothetical protein
MNKKVIYTAIYGNKDTLKNPRFVNPDFDYICFTDNKNVKSDVWKVIYSESIHEDPVRSAKIYKIKPHEFLQQYDISIWIDANFLILSDLNSFLQKAGNLKKANMLVFQHDQGRNCIYDEASTILMDKKDDPQTVTRQMKGYRDEGFPAQYGLTANSILLRRHNEQDIIDLDNLWWEQVEQHSRRDQLSFCYCKWKLDSKMFMLKYPVNNIRSNHWFQWLPHNYELQPWSF